MATAQSNPKIEDLKARLELEPKSRLFFPLAEELRKVGRLDEAERVLRERIDHHPAYLSAWVSLGRVLTQLQKHRSAVEAFDRALKIDPENIVAARFLAETFMALGEKVEAIKKFKLVHAFLPKDQDIAARIDELERELNPHKFIVREPPPATLEFVPNPPLEEPSMGMERSPVDDAFGPILSPEPVPDHVPPLPPEMVSFDFDPDPEGAEGSVPSFAREELERTSHTSFGEEPLATSDLDASNAISDSVTPTDGARKADGLDRFDPDNTQEMPLRVGMEPQGQRPGSHAAAEDQAGSFPSEPPQGESAVSIEAPPALPRDSDSGTDSAQLGDAHDMTAPDDASHPVESKDAPAMLQDPSGTETVAIAADDRSNGAMSDPDIMSPATHAFREEDSSAAAHSMRPHSHEREGESREEPYQRPVSAKGSLQSGETSDTIHRLESWLARIARRDRAGF